MNIVNVILVLLKTKPTFTVNSALFFLSQFYLAIFKYTELRVKEIFELAFKALYESNGHIPHLAATSFIANIIEHPQSFDAFCKWMSTKIEYFNATRVLIASSLIPTKKQRQKAAILTMASLMFYKCFSLAATLITCDFEVEKVRILSLVLLITTPLYTGIYQMAENSSLICSSFWMA